MKKNWFWHLLAMGCVVSLFLLPADEAPAVHKGSASFICSGCHTMHHSQDNGILAGWSAGVNDYLLVNTNANDELCYSCHDDNGGQWATFAATVPVVRNGSGTGLLYATTMGAGGDFQYLDGANDALTVDNAGNGHNFSDTANVDLVPAGTAAGAINFHCTTCHDAHGVVNGSETAAIDDWRNLRKDPDNDTTAINITNTTEGVALVNNVYPISNNIYGDQGNSGSGMSAWCGQCHDDFLVDGDPSPWSRHPTDEDMTDDTADGRVDVDWAYYNGNPEAGNGIKLPLQDSAASGTPNTAEEGNETADEIFCISCHFAHAGGDAGTGWADGLRWDNSAGLGAYIGCQQCHNK